MSMTDPIADFLARIRNAILARQAEVLAPSSKLKQRLCVLLKDEGYITAWDVRDNAAGMPEIVVRLRWADPRTNAIGCFSTVCSSGRSSEYPVVTPAAVV